MFVNKHRLFELYESVLRKQAWTNENCINLRVQLATPTQSVSIRCHLSSMTITMQKSKRLHDSFWRYWWPKDIAIWLAERTLDHDRKIRFFPDKRFFKDNKVHCYVPFPGLNRNINGLNFWQNQKSPFLENFRRFFFLKWEFFRKNQRRQLLTLKTL